jgi:hypothetical protein
MANFRMAMIALAAAAAMTGSQAMAADLSLAPGKPAGVQQAQHGTNLLVIAGVATALVVGVVIATVGSSNAVCGAAQGCTAANTVVTSTTS